MEQAATAYIISTHAPHAGSDGVVGVAHDLERISTHAPHAGSDVSGT